MYTLPRTSTRILNTMNNIEWLNRYVLKNYFSASDSSKRDYIYECFEVNHADWSVYFPALFEGKILYRDKHGRQHHSKSISIQVIEDENERSQYNDFYVFNEICIHTRIIPFFATLNSSIYNLVPKFLYMSVALPCENENAILITESLEEDGFRKLNSKKVFLDLSHLEIIMEKLGEFHAFSYQAKGTNPEGFHSQVTSLKTAYKWVQQSDSFVYLKLLNEYFLPLFSKDKRYKEKLEAIRPMLIDPKSIIDMCLTPEENISVLNVGAVPQILYKYDSDKVPCDVKFSVLKRCRYCTPVLDIGYVLYMLADQSIRDKYWDHLLNVYYTSLRNTFPESRALPEKHLIVNDFKGKSLFLFFFSILYLPYFMEAKENPNLNWFPMLYTHELEEYKYGNWYDMPIKIRAAIHVKLVQNKNSRIEEILNILRDILNRGFV